MHRRLDCYNSPEVQYGLPRLTALPPNDYHVYASSGLQGKADATVCARQVAEFRHVAANLQ